jgi:hypothetical protein
MSKMTFETLMGGHKAAEIRCPYKGVVVRRLAVEGDMIEVDAITVKVSVPLASEITYEAWVLDRGSLLFSAPGFGDQAKLCTEFDEIVFDDGSTGRVTLS